VVVGRVVGLEKDGVEQWGQVGCRGGAEDDRGQGGRVVLDAFGLCEDVVLEEVAGGVGDDEEAGEGGGYGHEGPGEFEGWGLGPHHSGEVVDGG